MPRGALRVLYAHARAVSIASAPGVSARSSRNVLLALVAFCDRDTWAGAWPALATLAGHADVSIRTARRALRVLEAAGVIATELGGGRRSSRYRIIRPASTPSVADQPGHDDRRPPVSTPLAPSGRKRRPAAAPTSTLNPEPESKPESKRKPMRKPKRIWNLPEDLRPLADALATRNLRAAFSLLPEQLAEVRRALAEHGIPALVRAAYTAYRSRRGRPAQTGPQSAAHGCWHRRRPSGPRRSTTDLETSCQTGRHHCASMIWSKEVAQTTP